MVNGLGATPSSINEINFPLLHNCEPESLEVLRGFARLNLNADQFRLKILESMPDEVRLWPIDSDRDFLIAAQYIGKLSEAFDMVKKRLSDTIENGKSKDKISLGGK